MLHQYFLLLATLALTARADARVSFMTANGNAITSLTGSAFNEGELNRVYTTTGGAGVYDSGMQILYNQLTKKNTDAPLVTVTLMNEETGFALDLMPGFDTIAQACSCFWIEGEFAVGRGAVTSDRYQLRFRSVGDSGVPAMDVRSGYFGISTSQAPTTVPSINTQKNTEYNPNRKSGAEMTRCAAGSLAMMAATFALMA